MKSIGNGEKPKGRRWTIRLSSQSVMKMIAASSLMSLLTLAMVLYSFYAIPARIEREQQSQVKRLEAMKELVDSVNELTENVTQMETQNVRTNTRINP